MTIFTDSSIPELVLLDAGEPVLLDADLIFGLAPQKLGKSVDSHVTF